MLVSLCASCCVRLGIKGIKQIAINRAKSHFVCSFGLLEGFIFFTFFIWLLKGYLIVLIIGCISIL